MCPIALSFGSLFFQTFMGCQDSTKDTATDNLEQSLEYPIAHAGADQYIQLGETVYLDAGDSTGFLIWDWDDGNRSEGKMVEHTYSEEGRYRVTLTSTADNGLQRSDTLIVTVYTESPALAAQVSKALLVTENAIWLTLEEGNSLQRFDRETSQLQSFDICQQPHHIAISGSILGITCGADDSVVLFDTETNHAETISLPRGSHPFGITAFEDSWYITSSSTGDLITITGEHITQSPFGTDLRGLTQLSDGTLLASRFRSDGVGLVYKWTNGNSQLLNFPIDLAGDSDNTTGGIPNLMEHVYPTLDESELFVPFLHANILRGEYLSNQNLTHETSLRAILGHIPLNTHIEDPSTRKHFDERGRANALAWNRFGDTMYVLHSSTGQISILDRFNLQILGNIPDIGHMALDLVVDEDELIIYVWLDRSIKIYDISNPALPVLKSEHRIVNQEPLSPELLLGKQLFHSAADTRITKTGYIACAHCHPDGSHDGQTWDFTDRGEGLRNTTSLLGRGGTLMGRVHWSGNFDEIQDFEHDMRGPFGGTGFLSEEDWNECHETLGNTKAGRNSDLDALAAYVTSLTTTPLSPYESSSETFETGMLRFASEGCEECHPPPLYTDSSLENPIRHDVGTLSESSGQRLGDVLDGLDTPTLLGVWRSPPYLHDGSVSTLEEAILAHDQYEQISPQTLSEIVQFLQNL